MANDYLSNIVSNLTDGNLDTTRRTDLGDRVLVIGTSSQGPENQPMRCLSPEDAELLFGPKELGSLVRGFNEVYYGPNGYKDIWLCRITNGKKATLALEEKPSADLDELPTELLGTQVTALTIEAQEAGEIFNLASFRQEIYDGQMSVICYNPVTGLETVIKYDPTGVITGSVKNVAELANAINLDTNMNKIVTATANDLDMSAQFTFTTSDVAESGTIVTDLGDTLIFDVSKALNDSDTSDDGYTESANVSPSGVPVTSGNNISELTEVYELTNSLVELKSASLAEIELPYPCQTASGISLTWLGLDGTTDGSGKAKHIVVNKYVDEADGTQKVFQFTAYEAVDPTTFHMYRTSSAGTTVEIAAADYTLTSVGGSANDNLAEVTLGASVAAPEGGIIITVTYDSEEFALTQASSRSACLATASYSTYFAAGDRVYWGTVQPCDIEICYPAKKTYDVDADVAIYDAAAGKILFGNPLKQPDYTITGGAQIYITWKYQPEWVNLGTGARALIGGTNGITMTNAVKYRLLGECYEALADFYCKCVVLKDTYLDDTKVVYDAETGLATTVNAGFGAQLEAFLEGLQDGVVEAYGTIAVKPAVSTKLADINAWFTRLTVVNTADKTRAANVMQTANYKHLSVTAFEPIVANNSVSVAYVTTGEAIYASLLCKLPMESAPTNKSLGSQVPYCRFKLSPRQINVLTQMRYVTTTLGSDGWKISDGMTAAAVGSDYARWTTYHIVSGVMDMVREVSEPYMGELFNPAKKAALDTQLRKRFAALKDKGILLDAEFALNQTPQEAALGILNIPLELWPAFETRKIYVTVKVRNT